MDYLQLTFRIVSVMGLLLILVLITGRRKIGELPVFDFLTIIILGNVVGADIADPEIPQLPTAYAVVLLIGIQYLMSYGTIKYRKFGSKVSFGPTVIIQNGQFINSNMKRLRYTIENVLMFLREKGIFDINEVEFAIVEDSGNISVLKKSHYQPLTPNDMEIQSHYKGLSVPLIVEGKVYERNLKKLNLDKMWLKAQLKNNNINHFNEVFYVDINTEGKLYISKVMEPNNISNDYMI
ncbi:protein of unknown function DUF421 [Alkaliphilus metalliredigens QYMF]|uniref:DUF421 domain-containing protein n=1 Tax=Alkaliphilus metalliredigens (strain QYMF) TaxID=293826 RepID=A6TUH8_ALKMQ|nr:DUF421 domain-containing protein [Alkaliphilus metalliredigens]ABR49846.1 protein of unknown function DUF421 [Alkaliphilus metalliredigens QYMF]